MAQPRFPRVSGDPAGKRMARNFFGNKGNRLIAACALALVAAGSVGGCAGLGDLRERVSEFGSKVAAEFGKMRGLEPAPPTPAPPQASVPRTTESVQPDAAPEPFAPAKDSKPDTLAEAAINVRATCSARDETGYRETSRSRSRTARSRCWPRGSTCRDADSAGSIFPIFARRGAFLTSNSLRPPVQVA